MEDNRRELNILRGSVVARLSAVGALLTGAGGLVGCIVGLDFPSGGGTYLLAAAVAFGLLAIAVSRD